MTTTRPHPKLSPARAIEEIERGLRRLYGDRLYGVFLFGSRARGDHRPDSDIDLAVVLHDEHIDRWNEMKAIRDIAFPLSVEAELIVHTWPVALRDWLEPEAAEDAHLLRGMRQDSVALGMDRP